MIPILKSIINNPTSHSKPPQWAVVVVNIVWDSGAKDPDQTSIIIRSVNIPSQLLVVEVSL